ncbi:hypothetical protein PAHAL_9G336200 [Panicum hallii]|uniref:Ubiquitin-like protease family profile domain-containing protein n=1 Tax=Panicum hallii TaxID=206008 RepID=A0A2T8I3B3_9POAL|nr:hypothetical protein PAHAL_9G336200 [Panicum hallii]
MTNCTMRYTSTSGSIVPKLTLGTYVLSEDPTQKRRKIISPWVLIKMMTEGEMFSKMVEKAFDFLDTDYDMVIYVFLFLKLVLIPVHQENAEDLSGDGHWFIVVVNMKARMFQVIDSLRNPDDMIHDCGLFTLKAIEYWDGCKLPNLKEFDKFTMRKQILAKWFHSPANKIERKSDFCLEGKGKNGTTVGNKGSGGEG